jgi:tetratricopeptide (TPR) repeat protein
MYNPDLPRHAPSLLSLATSLIASAALAVFCPPTSSAAGAATAAAAHGMTMSSGLRFVPPAPGERVGTVFFAVSCAPAVQKSFSRGVALLHDFWYQEAQSQFTEILRQDPGCSIAHWGIAMSVFHQIWDRPNPEVQALAKSELEQALAHPPQTARERGFVEALAAFFVPAGGDYQARIEAYAASMGKLYAANPGDVDVGAFYALALLASHAATDASVAKERQAMTVLTPLFAKYPDHPGVVHYIIHACDNPALAPDGLAAARHYGEIAASAPHAVHMPGHIFSRLGMWREDIEVNRASVEASKAASARRQSGSMDQFHSDDFLLYAYLQSAEDANARGILADSKAMMASFESMGDIGDHYMTGMFPYYRSKLPIFFDLEMRDWKAAAALEPIAAAPPETQALTWWARAVADGHLHRPAGARADLAAYDGLMVEIKKGRNAYVAESVGGRIRRGEMTAWAAFAQGGQGEALARMREAADLQDKVGQGEVDIPAREMLADMLLEQGRAREALTEYDAALKLSPKRFNALYNAGTAAESIGDKPRAKRYYAALLEQTGNGSSTARPELAHVKAFVSSVTVAER